MYWDLAQSIMGFCTLPVARELAQRTGVSLPRYLRG